MNPEINRFLSGPIEELDLAWVWLRGTLACLPAESREEAEKGTPALSAIMMYREAYERSLEA